MRPVIRPTVARLRLQLGAAGVPSAIPIPTDAVGCILSFAADLTSQAMSIWGYVGIDVDAAAADLADLGEHPNTPVRYVFSTFLSSGDVINTRDKFLHVACDTENAYVRGMWLFGDDDGDQP